MPDTATAAVELMNAPDTAATPSTPDSSTPAPAATTPQTPATPAFLEINDRTKYASKEDAIKGWNEAQNRISSLSQWEQVIAAPLDKGGFGITDPRQVAQLLDELATIRASQQTATPSNSQGTRSDAGTVQAAAQGDKKAYDSLTPEWKQHVDFLRNQLGFVTQDALKPLQDQVQQLSQSQQAAQEAHLQEARRNGESTLNGLIEKSGLAADDTDKAQIANAIEDAIVRNSRDARGNIIPGSPEDRFIRGDAAERASIIENHFKWFQQFGDKYATAKTASYVKDKSAAQASQPRNLPQSTPPGSTTRTGRLSDEDRKKALTELLAAGGMS